VEVKKGVQGKRRRLKEIKNNDTERRPIEGKEFFNRGKLKNRKKKRP